MVGGHVWQAGCAWQGECVTGKHAWQDGHVWQGVMYGRGADVAGGAWQGACVAGGMHGRGHMWLGACMAGGGKHPTGMHSCCEKQAIQIFVYVYVSLRLCVQNGVSRLISALCVNCLISILCTMRKLSECYSGIFQTQSSGCVSGLDHFRNFTNLKILNI